MILSRRDCAALAVVCGFDYATERKKYRKETAGVITTGTNEKHSGDHMLRDSWFAFRFVTDEGNGNSRGRRLNDFLRSGINRTNGKRPAPPNYVLGGHTTQSRHRKDFFLAPSPRSSIFAARAGVRFAGAGRCLPEQFNGTMNRLELAREQG